MQSLGMIAYEAYCQDAGGVSLVSGDPLPTWDNLPLNFTQAWESAAQAVARRVGGSIAQGIKRAEQVNRS